MKDHYRVGGKQPRNVYYVTAEFPEGKYIGVFFEEAWARLAVTSLNFHLEQSNAHRSDDEKPPVVVFYEAA